MAASELRIVDVTLAHLPWEKREDRFERAVEITQLLQGLGVSCIETGSITEPWRFDLTYRLGQAVKDLGIMPYCPLDRRMVTCAAEALKTCSQPRLGLILPTSRESTLGSRWHSYSALLAVAEDMIVYATRLGLPVNVVLSEASATDPLFVARTARLAVEAGAACVTVVDPGRQTAGEFSSLIRRVVNTVPGVPVGVRCGNKMGAATAFTAEAVALGVREIGVVAGEWGADLVCPSLPALVSANIVDAAGDALKHLSAAIAASTALKPGVVHDAAS